MVTLTPHPGRGRQGIRAASSRCLSPRKKKRSNFLRGVSIWTNAAVTALSVTALEMVFSRDLLILGVSWSSAMPRLVPGRGENKWRNNQGEGEAVAVKERGKQQ